RGRLERRNPQPCPKVDDSAPTESGAGPPVASVERDELRLRRGHEDAAAAPGAGGRGLVEPGGDAAAREVPVAHVALDLGIEHPALPTGGGVKRDHPAQRGAYVD